MSCWNSTRLYHLGILINILLKLGYAQFYCKRIAKNLSSLSSYIYRLITEKMKANLTFTYARSFTLKGKYFHSLKVGKSFRINKIAAY